MTATTRHEGPNGTGFILIEGTSTLAHYPHARAAGGLLWVSGLSARRPDQSIPGVIHGPDGVSRDFMAQAEGVLDNLERVLAAAGANLSHVVDVFAMLVDLADYPAFNEAYNRRFDAKGGPTRTTCVVKSLPLPDLLIELKVVAVDPGARS